MIKNGINMTGMPSSPRPALRTKTCGRLRRSSRNSERLWRDDFKKWTAARQQTALRQSSRGSRSTKQ